MTVLLRWDGVWVVDSSGYPRRSAGMTELWGAGMTEVLRGGVLGYSSSRNCLIVSTTASDCSTIIACPASGMMTASVPAAFARSCA